MLVMPEAKTEIAKLCTKQLDLFLKGKITEAELNREMAYMLLQDEVFCEVVPEYKPTRPTAMDGYDRLSQEQKLKIGNDEAISAYFKACRQAENSNAAKIHWLKDAKKDIPEGDFLSHQKINERLRQFEGCA